MSLQQLYSTELSSIFDTTPEIHDDNASIEQTLNSITNIKQQDTHEKCYFHTLNNRLEDLLHLLNDVKSRNKNLYDELTSLKTNMNLNGENSNQYLQDLDNIRQCWSEKNHHNIIEEVEIKVFLEQIQLIDRFRFTYLEIYNAYNNKHAMLFDLLNQLENDLKKVQYCLDISNSQMQSYEDDYQHELTRFYSYLSERTQMTSERQILISQIQLLRDKYNLCLTYNQEEINEWKILLNILTQNSKNFYEDSLEEIKQQFQIDYQQILKEQQADIENELRRKFQKIQDKIHMNLIIYENNERLNREQTEHLEHRFNEHKKEYDSLESNYRQSTEEIQHKRRILEVLEDQRRKIILTSTEQRACLEKDIDVLRTEYYQLKDELDQLAYIIRFDINEELRIYQALLNSLYRVDDKCLLLFNGLNHFQPSNANITRDISINCLPQYRPLSNDTVQKKLNENIDGNQYETQSNTIHQNHMGTASMMTQPVAVVVVVEMNKIQNEKDTLKFDDHYVQCVIHYKRKYKGKILIKLADAQGGFVEIENIGNHSHELTGWYINRIVDGKCIRYIFPEFRLDSHKTVRIYGNNYFTKFTTSMTDKSDLQLIASNFCDWSIGRHMRTELFNHDDIFKALFEQVTDD